MSFGLPFHMHHFEHFEQKELLQVDALAMVGVGGGGFLNSQECRLCTLKT